jgi:hypothetical protein
MGGKGDEVNRAGLIVVFTERKSVSPSQRGAARFCIPDIQINAAADVVTDNGALAATSLLHNAMRMPENTIHAEGFRVIASSGHVVEDAMQKQRIA